MEYPKIEPADLLKRLEHPGKKVDFVLDTDTYNEIDDQFAVVYSLLSKETVNVKAIYAAPFHNKRSDGPGDGMQKSYEEILRVLERINVSPEGLVHKGSTSWLPEKEKPVESDAARHVVELAKASDGPLYVAPIGAPTNIASAILMDPSIIEKIVILWLGGSPYYWPSAHEFNLKQDIPSSQVLFDSGVPFVRFPCQTVTQLLQSTIPEMEHFVKGKGAIGDYLYEIFVDYKPEGAYAWSKVVWDIITVAWLVNPACAPTNIIHAPRLTDNCTWSFDHSRHFMREAFTANRDMIFGDLFKKIEAAAG